MVTRDSNTMTNDVLGQADDFRKIGTTLTETASGTLASAIFQGRRIALGGFSVDRPIFSESPSFSTLGLGFWSRFVVTFDFPNQSLYLQKGRGYERPDLLDLSGLHLLRRDGTILVHSVDQGSPASKAGFRADDRLLTLGALRAGETTLFARRSVLSHEGMIKCSVRRGSSDQNLDLKLTR